MANEKITFEEARERVLQHVKARKWDQSTDPRGLAVSISLEASELLEYFQWRDKTAGTTDDLASELADIFIYGVQFAEKFNIDIPTAMAQKLEKTAKKYPVEIFEITDEEERHKVWLEAKQSYKKDTTL